MKTLRQLLLVAVVITSWAPYASTSSTGERPDVVLIPVATGTVEHFLEFDILRRAPVANNAHSSYSRTTAENRRFRRGFIEFDLSGIDGTIDRAVLILREHHAITNPGRISAHEIAFYPADLLVDIDDYHQPTEFLETFDSDSGLLPTEFSFDVSSAFGDGVSDTIGFRVKTEVDPEYDALDNFGTAFVPAPSALRLELFLGETRPVVVDVKPGTCRNPLNVASRGVVHVVVLGNPEVDVEQLDVASLRLSGVAPTRSRLADRGSSEGRDGCPPAAPDGFLDLILKFDVPELVQGVENALGRVLTNRETVDLELQGRFLEEFGRVSIEGHDAVTILKPRQRGGKKR